MIFKFRGDRAPGAGSNPLDRSLRLADGFRDQGTFDQAARHYEDALALAPARTDIKVQLANMLKDSGDLPRAESMYREALRDDPRNADINLQLGHLYKIHGRRAAALACYRQALELNPLLGDARLELVAAGDPGEQLSAFERQMRLGGVDVLLTIRSRLDEIAAQIAEIRLGLPDAQASVAFPVEAYGEFRRTFDCPAPAVAWADISFAIIILADREPLERLQSQISAVLEQEHGLWALRVVGSDAVRRQLVERAAARNSQIEWVQVSPRVALAAEEYSVAISGGEDWIVFLCHGALIHRRALSWIAAVATHAGVDAVVSDEEFGDPSINTQQLWPVFRQIVDPDTVLEANVYGENIAVERRSLETISEISGASTISIARDMLILRLVRERRVAHIPLPLFCRQGTMIPEPTEVAVTHIAAVTAHIGNDPKVQISESSWSSGTLRILKTPVNPDAKISLIICTKIEFYDLCIFLQSLINHANNKISLDIIICNNGDASNLRSALSNASLNDAGITILDIDEPFNWSRFNNIGARSAKSPYLLFANDDMRMLTPGWDEVVRSFLERPDVGALGARLLYPDDTIQHAGVLFNWRGSVIHDGLYRSVHEPGPTQRWHVTRAVSAVTGAFLATRRSDFENAGGFDEKHLAVSYSDIDYALKQRAQGRRVIWTPMVSLHHYESKTRGLDHLSAAKAARDAAERKILTDRWGEALLTEPSLNPFWQQATLPHRLLGFPSERQIWRHIELSSALNPWTVRKPRF